MSHMTRFTVATGHVVKAIMAVMCTKLGPSAAVSSAAVSSAAVEGLGLVSSCFAFSMILSLINSYFCGR